MKKGLSNIYAYVPVKDVFLKVGGLWREIYPPFSSGLLYASAIIVIKDRVMETTFFKIKNEIK